MKKILEMVCNALRSFLKQRSDTTVVEESNASILRMDLKRITRTKKSTIGRLYLNGLLECFTLEDEDKLRQGLSKVYGKTAIPAGEYVVGITYSPKYRRQMPLLKAVPGFSGIRIHSGNWAKDSEGCILVGQTKGKNFIGESRLAYKALFKKLQVAKKAGRKIVIKIH